MCKERIPEVGYGGKMNPNPGGPGSASNHNDADQKHGIYEISSHEGGQKILFIPPWKILSLKKKKYNMEKIYRAIFIITSD